MAEKELYIDAKIPLVSKAEAIENVALFRLEKILFTYMNWPEKPNVSWLLSADNGIPNTVALNENIQVKSNISGLGTTGNGSIQKASNIYSLMHISESQIDTFNEFLQKKYPGKIEAYLIDFQGLYEDVIDSLHKEWHQYLYSGNIAPDTIKSNLNLNKTPVASDKLTLNNATVSPNFLFKVQIAASRVQMSQQVLKGIYSGNEEIVESFEDKWFKYTIGQFMSYNDARNCRDRINVKGAFVIAYLNGKRMKIPLTL
jgi:hypothetical protein